MTGYLLDTSVALFASAHSVSLSSAVRSAIERGPNYLSVVSYWEVVLKNMKGKLDIGDPRNWWLEALDQLSATSVLLRPDHIAEVYHLPSIHKDPFDRVLIAQAKVENLTLLTTDEAICRYAGNGFRAIR